MLLELKKKNDRNWHQPVKGIVKLRKQYPDSIIDAACKRALHFGAHSYSVVKRIIENNGYNLPLSERGEYANNH